MAKRISVGLLFIALTFLISGCFKNGRLEKAEYVVYYLNNEETALVETPFLTLQNDEESLLMQLKEALNQGPKDKEYKRSLPDEVEIIRCSIENGQLGITFSKEYLELANYEEVLCRAAVVKTFSQLASVDNISFYVNDILVSDRNSAPLSVMTADSFIENSGASINAYQTEVLVLYFANDTGDKLIKAEKELRYDSNVPLEKIIVEELMKGPFTEDTYPVIPEETKLNSISLKDGVCYVNFDRQFLKQTYDVQEEIAIYAIVNSLSEMNTISSVQISVESETDIVYRESISLDQLFERNLDLVKEEKNSSSADDSAPPDKEQQKKQESVEKQEMIKKGE